jgi:Ca2+-binding RTX toxin-like protein
VVRRGHLIAFVVAFMIGCAVLLVVGCAGVRSEAPQDEQQGHTEATKKEQGRSPEATASEEARCGGTRSIHLQERTYTTNDIPGCPNKGGLLLGTDKTEKIRGYGGPYLGDKLAGEDGDDEIRGLGANDWIFGGLGSDVIYGGDGNDILEGGSYSQTKDESSKDVLHGGPGTDDLTDFDGGDDVLYGGDGDDKPLAGGAGEDVIYGGDGNDLIDAVSADSNGFQITKERDEIYCGEGEDQYIADKLDYVDSSCEVGGHGGGGANA